MSGDTWIDIGQELPPVGKIVEVTGPSAYITHPYFLTLGKLEEEENQREFMWTGLGGMRLSDYGNNPTHWRECQPNPLSGSK